MKCMRWQETKFVWNSLTSTYSALSKTERGREEEMTCASKRYQNVYVCSTMSSLGCKCRTGPSRQSSCMAKKHTPETRAQYLHHTYCQPRNLEGQCSRPPIFSCVPGQGERSPSRCCCVRVRNVGGVLFSRGRLLGFKGSASTCPCTRHPQPWFNIDKDRAWHMFPCTCFGEESVERVFSSNEGLLIWPLTVRQSALFETVQLPACVACKCEHVVTSTDGLVP